MLAKRVPGLTALLILVPILAILMLGVTLTIQCCKHQWFNVYHTEFNLYKLIYQVTNFAVKHNYPLHRSAFTFCESTIPTRLDFGKERYGGPFTTEQIEDVKTFLKILCLLLALGPIFAVDITASNQLPTVAYHLADNSYTALLQPLTNTSSVTYPTILALNGSITPLMITLAIPLYICLLWLYIYKYIPSVFKQTGLTMIFFIGISYHHLTVRHSWTHSFV